ncbi:MAG TPA: NAD(P)-dependent oxidoreductase [Candidatus Lokiarchaeia archaeon]|nr:NAD(P)-dependent oxidoreductase [Candidatus Lokiarchaeia archaeon]
MVVVGFIGLGIMGESMSERIVNAGYEVWVYDLNSAQVDKLVAIGAQPAGSIMEVAEHADQIIIMVPNSEHVQDVVHQLLPALREGTIIIDMSTISPEVSRILAQEVAAAGNVMVDAPVVKSKAAAISGDLGILVGADDPAIVEEITPLLANMGKNIIRMGSNGSGLVMKLCHNALVAEIQNGVNEMLVLAGKAGIDFDSFVKAVSYGGGQNLYLDSKAETIKARDFTPKFPFEHMAKDLNLASDLAKEFGLSLPGVEQCLKIYAAGLEDGLHREDHSASFKIVEKISSGEL